MLLFLLQSTPTPTPLPVPLIASSPWSDPVTVATVVIAVCTVVYSVLTYFILRATAANTRITNKIFEAANRPYLGLQSVNTKLRDESIEFICVARNFGSVPAHNVEILSHVATIDGTAIDLARLVEFGGFSIYPGSEKSLHLSVGDESSYDAISKNARLDMSVTLRYEGLASQKYEYNYQGMFYLDGGGQFVPIKEDST
jgi:hypothetical protein